MSPPGQWLPRRRDDVVLRDDDNRSVLAVPEQDDVAVLNLTARAVWELCDGATTIEELTAALCEIFAVTPEQAATDVKHALKTMDAAGLVEWAPAGRAGEP